MIGTECIAFAVTSRTMVSILLPRPRLSWPCVLNCGRLIRAVLVNSLLAVAYWETEPSSRTSTYCQPLPLGPFETDQYKGKTHISNRANGRPRRRWMLRHTTGNFEMCSRGI